MEEFDIDAFPLQNSNFPLLCLWGPLSKAQDIIGTFKLNHQKFKLIPLHSLEIKDGQAASNPYSDGHSTKDCWHTEITHSEAFNLRG